MSMSSNHPVSVSGEPVVASVVNDAPFRFFGEVEKLTFDANTETTDKNAKRWKQPFLRPKFTPKDVASVLSYTRPFSLGTKCVESCKRALNHLAMHQTVASGINMVDTITDMNDASAGGETHDDTENTSSGRETDEKEPVVKTDDYWGRDDIILPNGMSCRNTVMFARDLHKGWDKAVLDDASVPPSSKKRRMDALLRDVYNRYVLISDDQGIRSEKLKHMFVCRATQALKSYCALRGWKYGRDALLASSGRGVDCVPQHVRERMPEEVFPLHLYEVFLRDASPSSHREVQLLMIHVVYAVETIMREGNDKQAWVLSDRALENEISRFRDIDPSISSVRSAEAVGKARNKDSGAWIVRDDGGRFEGTVIKAADCLAWGNAKRDDESTVQGGRRAVRERTPNSSLYVACAWPAGADESVSVKIKYDAIVSATANDASPLSLPSEIASDANGMIENTSAKTLRCSAEIFTVRIAGIRDPRRVYNLDMATYYPYTFVKMDGVSVPTLYMTWQGEMYGFFGWLNAPATVIDPDTARAKAQRLIWVSSALDVQWRQQNRVWTNDMISDSAPGAEDARAAHSSRQFEQFVRVCVRETLDMLTTLRCALTVSEGVLLNSVNNLTYPFSQILEACGSTCAVERRPDLQHREWVKAVLSGAIMSVSSKLLLP